MSLSKYIIKNDLVVLEPDLMTWAEFMEIDRPVHHKVNRIAGLMLSTIFLGLDHQYGEGEPVLWETMLFNEDERATSKIFGKDYTFASEMGQWRFSFMPEAYAFHDNKLLELQAQYRATLDQFPNRARVENND